MSKHAWLGVLSARTHLRWQHELAKRQQPVAVCALLYPTTTPLMDVRHMTADPAGRVCSAVAINNQRRLFEWKLCEIYRISFGVDLDACICYGKSRNMEQQRQTYVQQHAAAHRHTTRPTIERFNTRRRYNLASQTAHTLVIHAWSHGLVATRSTATPAGRWASESVAVRGAEAAAAEAAAPAAGEPLGPADVGAVGPAEAGAPEPVALRLARPRLRHRHRPDLCSSTQQHLRQIIISRLPPAAS